MKNKFAFTLAEVLITLVIIGVVAALTIPTAINKYKEQELKTQFAKGYSTLLQALNKTEIYDFYGYARCYYDSRVAGGAPTRTDCTAFYNKFFKNLSVQKVCNGNAKNDGCVPVYQSYNTGSTCLGFQEHYINDIDYSAVLSNGMIIIVSSIGSSNYFPAFLIDINGHKGPNAYGKDLFSFEIRISPTTSNLYLNGGNCEFPVSGGRRTSDMIKYALIKK